MEKDYIVGFTLFGVKYNGFKTYYRHFSTLEDAERFTSNVKIKDSSKIYVNIEACIPEMLNKILRIDYIPKQTIREFIDRELPDNDICECCEIYDVNGIDIKNKLLGLLERNK